MLFVLFPDRDLIFVFSTCPGIVTCDHLVTNSEPLGYSCPHEARLVLSGTMLHQINYFNYTQILLGFFFVLFFRICIRETLYFLKLGGKCEQGSYEDQENLAKCENLTEILW